MLSMTVMSEKSILWQASAQIENPLNDFMDENMPMKILSNIDETLDND